MVKARRRARGTGGGCVPSGDATMPTYKQLEQAFFLIDHTSLLFVFKKKCWTCALHYKRGKGS